MSEPTIKIGVTYTGTDEKHSNYVHWLKGNEHVEITTLSPQHTDLDSIKNFDGIVLSGGVDMHPKFYNSTIINYPHAPQHFHEERDEFEIAVFQEGQQNNIPVLAVCRGLQMINCILGGTLTQDIGPEANGIHKFEHHDKAHGINIEPATLLNEITGVDRTMTNSAHHQCINKLGNGLLVNCKSDDGIVEGIEWADKENKAFFLGIQWHPERMYKFHLGELPSSKNIRDRFIQEIKKSKKSSMKIINPATEAIISEVAEDSIETIKEKFELLKKGQQAWAKISVAERVAVIQKFYDLLEENKDELANTLTSEMGKPLQQSYNEVNGARGRIKFFIDNSEKYLAEEWITSEGATKEKIVYEPLGVIANISAWNYPFLVGVNVFIPALIGGNAVFYKPSEYATLTGLHIEALLYKAGVPENCFQTAIGRGQVGEELLQLPLNGYFFTGSYRTGKYIAEKVAGKMVPCQLELGGKDPLYVMDDVENIEKTAGDALEGVVYNSGQSCCAVERIYVQEKVYDAFVKAYVEQCKKLTIGNPLYKTTDIGPLSRKEQQAFLSSQVDDAVILGATVMSGGKIPSGKGYYFEPTVLTNVNHAMKVMTEESFGPVVGIQKVKDDAEAIQLMQDTVYGLTASVYSKNFDRAAAVMEQMQTGTVYWNCCDRVSASLPWSGRKQSGFGATLSYQGIRAFVQPKAYHIRG